MNKNQNTPLIIIAVVVVVAGTLLFMKMKQDQVSKMDTATNTTSEEMIEQTSDDKTATDTDKDVQMVEGANVKTITVEAGSFYYKPAVMTVKKGETVKIVMTSKDMMHDFNIDELGVKLPVTKSGDTQVVEFTPTKTGTFEYYCSVGQHRKNGQVGKITVE